MKRITILADNNGADDWQTEHGLSLLLESSSGEITLFDTGAGSVLPYNLQKSGIPPEKISRIVLSHGHYDHTGGLEYILEKAPDAEVFCGCDITIPRYSLHPGVPVRELTMPASSIKAMQRIPESRRHIIKDFSAIDEGIFITGAIGRESFEDCGGPFFLDHRGTHPDLIQDEIAMLTGSGALIQGCCHAGIINTVEHCRRNLPDVKINTVIGGLHLLHASENRLQKTAEYLDSLGLEKIILLHCTGSGAMDFLNNRLKCEVICGKCGDCYEF